MSPEELAEYEQLQREREQGELEGRERARRDRASRLLERSGVSEKARGHGLDWLSEHPHQKEAREMLSGLLEEFRAGGRDWWLVLQGERLREGANPGANGIGKSTLAIAAAVEVCRMGVAARFTPEARLTREIFSRMGRQGDLSEFIDCLTTVPLLALDNMGTDGDFTRGGVAPVNEFLRSQLFDVLDSRMDAPLPVIITTNLMPDEFEARYGHDIYSRVFGMTARRATWVSFAGPDLRKDWRAETPTLGL